jgi:hypothetical protein
MKSLILSIIFITTFSSGNKLSPLLNLYLDVKDALVSSNADTAAAKASEFVQAINAVNGLSDKEQAAFAPLKEKLLSAATAIAKTTDLAKQRAQFKGLSDNIYTLSKAVKLSEEPLYQDYCPMQKSYWLSKDAGISNPYYGKQMLTCGKVTDTL